MKDMTTEFDLLRQRILADPDAVLQDREIMRALLEASERSRGGNVVDLRGIAMERLETRLDRLEDTHRSVIAAAYDNLAGTTQVHRSVLTILDVADFSDFMAVLNRQVAAILRVDTIGLAFESTEEAAPNEYGGYLQMVAPGTIGALLQNGREATSGRKVLLQRAEHGSEALLSLDLGPDRSPGLLILASADPMQFTAAQATDLLEFFAGVVERQVVRWLS
jgi:uncharacterized protein YigA (DUF484 family)